MRPDVRITQYSVSALSRAQDPTGIFDVLVAYDNRFDAWAVRRTSHGEVLTLSRFHEWDTERDESSYDWLRTHRFSIGQALDLAEHWAGVLAASTSRERSDG